MDDSQIKIGAPDPNAYPNVELHYYYDREKRLDAAPGRIKSRNSSQKGGFFHSLTDTAPKLMLLITIVVLCVVIAILRYVQ